MADPELFSSGAGPWMTTESVIRYGHLNEIQRIHPELKLRIISKYTGEMLTYDASMNFPKSLKM